MVNEEYLFVLISVRGDVVVDEEVSGADHSSVVAK